MATNCYCRGNGVCDTCDGHTCTGGCTCQIDGAPQNNYGWVNPSPTRLDAWTQKQEARR